MWRSRRSRRRSGGGRVGGWRESGSCLCLKNGSGLLRLCFFGGGEWMEEKCFCGLDHIYIVEDLVLGDKSC